MSTTKQLEIYRTLGGGEQAVGWLRDDLKGVAHVFAKGKPGEMFQTSDGYGGPHWPCPVCDSHGGYSAEDFDRQMRELTRTVTT